MLSNEIKGQKAIFSVGIGDERRWENRNIIEKKRDFGGKKAGEKMKKENYWFASYPHLLPNLTVTGNFTLFACHEIHQGVMHCGSRKFLPFAFRDLGVLLWDATGI